MWWQIFLGLCAFFVGVPLMCFFVVRLFIGINNFLEKFGWALLVSVAILLSPLLLPLFGPSVLADKLGWKRVGVIAAYIGMVLVVGVLAGGDYLVEVILMGKPL